MKKEIDWNGRQNDSDKRFDNRQMNYKIFLTNKMPKRIKKQEKETDDILPLTKQHRQTSYRMSQTNDVYCIIKQYNTDKRDIAQGVKQTIPQTGEPIPKENTNGQTPKKYQIRYRNVTYI